MCIILPEMYRKFSVLHPLTFPLCLKSPYERVPPGPPLPGSSLTLVPMIYQDLSEYSEICPKGWIPQQKTEGSEQRLLKSRRAEWTRIRCKGINRVRSHHIYLPLSEGWDQPCGHERVLRWASTLRAHHCLCHTESPLPTPQGLGQSTHVTQMRLVFATNEGLTFAWVRVSSFLQPTGARVPLKKKKKVDIEERYVLWKAVKSRRITGCWYWRGACLRAHLQ